jgi:cytochrome c biogenesis protein CcmG/thiol:disulfide interchange protein DsbE
MPPSIQHPLSGNAAPAFEVASLDSRSIAVPSRSPRTRATVIDFWASWCAPCLEAMPGVERLYRDRKDDGLVVVGVSVDGVPEDAAASSKQAGVTFPIVHDAGMRVAGAYRVASVPITFLLDQSGAVRWVGRDPEALRHAVDVVLSEPRARGAWTE